MDGRYFSNRIVEWYLNNSRKLPWRETKDPYSIWLSEIILQQTRVSQGLPYYHSFIQKYPTVFHLARAKPNDVLRLWQGLGYYTRARNLHACARTVVKDFNGVFPSNFNDLKKLPGIGDYTAAAIASICFKQPVAVVDGNVFRVLARVFGIEKDIASPEGKRYFFDQANKVMGESQPDVYNQSIMEFGALHCTPKQPGCANCVMTEICVAYKNDLQDLLPVKSRTARVRKRYFYYFVINNGGKIAMKKRDDKDIWNGLYDFYLIEKTRPVSFLNVVMDDPLLKKINSKKHEIQVSKTYKHVLSHQVIMARFITITMGKNLPSSLKTLDFYSKKRIHALPKPILINRYLTQQNIL